jgi:4-hydroxybenzoate polyprenyltransferase
LADLGISFSIAYYLYEPIANGDEHKISQIMNFFKKVYTVIGFVVLGVGLALTPFLGWFISGESTIPNLSLIYILYVINSNGIINIRFQKTRTY